MLSSAAAPVVAAVRADRLGSATFAVWVRLDLLRRAVRVLLPSEQGAERIDILDKSALDIATSTDLSGAVATVTLGFTRGAA